MLWCILHCLDHVLTSHSLCVCVFRTTLNDIRLISDRGVHKYQVERILLNENKQKPNQFMWNSQMMRIMIMIHNKSQLHKVIGPLRFQFIWLANWWCSSSGNFSLLLSSFSRIEISIESTYKLKHPQIVNSVNWKFWNGFFNFDWKLLSKRHKRSTLTPR